LWPEDPQVTSRALSRAVAARNTALAALKALDEPTLERMHQMGRYSATADGWATSTTSERGGGDLTSVEAAASSRQNGRTPDRVGDWLDLLFANLARIGDLAEVSEGLRQLIVNIKTDGPERLTPSCIACAQDALPRPKRGMCWTCYMQWYRTTPRPDIAAFIVERMHATKGQR
jgi:hypothetical protein